MSKKIAELIRKVPDFPKPGILFYDITTLLTDGAALKETVQSMANLVKDAKFDCVAAVESRGFIFGSALANFFGCGLILVRKKGKLPGETRGLEYGLEYGKETLELTDVAFASGAKRVLLVDDVLATGGTATAATNLIRQCGAEVVQALFLIELLELKGRERLAGTPVASFITY